MCGEVWDGLLLSGWSSSPFSLRVRVVVSSDGIVEEVGGCEGLLGFAIVENT